MTRPVDDAADPAEGPDARASSRGAGAGWGPPTVPERMFRLVVRAWRAVGLSALFGFLGRSPPVRWLGGKEEGSLRWALARFLPLSAAIHAAFGAPWPRLIVAILALLGATKSVWQEEPDAPTVIPIDLDSLEDEADRGAGVKNAGEGEGPGGVKVFDAGVDALDGGGADALEAGGIADARPDAPSDAGPKRIRDPNALAGGLAGLAPPGKEVNVSMVLRIDHMRTHPLAADVGPLLLRIEQWKPFFENSGLDPMQDIDVLYTFGPKFRDTSRVTAVVVHNRDDELFATILDGVMAKLEGKKIEDPDVRAWNVTVDKAPRVFVQLPGGLIITPPDGEKQALSIARQLVQKKRSAKLLVPKSDPDLLVGLLLRTPGNPMKGIPADLQDAHVTLRLKKDGGLSGDIDAKAKDEATAKADAKVVTDWIEERVPGGPIGFFIRPYVRGYTVESDGNVVRAHHELDGDQVDSVARFVLKRIK
jgi:hypothetical protein